MWRKALVLVSLVATGWWLLHTRLFQNLELQQQLQGFFVDYGLWAWPLFTLSCIGFTAVGGSRQLIALACGVLLGGWLGALVSTVYTLVGAVLTIGFSYYLAPAWLYRRFGNRLSALQKLLDHRTWLWICTLRLLPIGSNLVTNLACGLVKLPLKHVMLGSAIGYLPQMLLFSYIGSGLAFNDMSQLVISSIFLLGSILLGTVLYQQQKKTLASAGLKEPSDAH